MVTPVASSAFVVRRSPEARRRTSSIATGITRPPPSRSRGRLQPPERFARDLAVVEGNRPVGELLSLLVALARDDDDVALARLRERAGNRGRAVRLHVDRALDAVEDLGDDRAGL